ncbi:MAG TPA: hypothetical protein VLJ57_02830 [Burkholderiaceae bacterium]|nr:hypothetical protein [Burkholderiaceae bacterium]
MKWTKLPKGKFTGIDWAKPGATAGFDPYLIWAEADQFAGYGKHQPQWLSLILQLTPGTSVAQLTAAASPKWLHIAPVYTSVAAPAGLRFCTARVRPAFFKELRQGGVIHGLVKRFELGMPLGNADDPTGAGTPPYAPVGKLLDGKVIGMIDGGLAFAQANFLRNGKARAKYFWRQDHQGWGPSPAATGYGHELTASDIDHALKRYTFNGLVDEELVYRHFQMGMPLEKLVNHGTHVLDLAAGPRTLEAQVARPDAPPSWALADDDASRAPIVAVQLDWDTIIDTSGGSMNVHILDGLMYILSRCAPGAKIAVNMSWGTLAGPHDGTSVLEAAMDELIHLQSGRLDVVLPVSNSYQSRTHANVSLSKNERVTLHWRGQPGDSSQNFLEIWVQEGHEGLEIAITPPGRSALPPLKFGESAMWIDGGDKPICSLIYPASVATGERGTCALVAVAPTFSFHHGTATAPSGVWEVSLVNRQKAPVTVDAYVERDDEIIGVRTGSRQSHFEDRWYDTSGNPDSFVDHPGNPSPIRRSGNFNSIATGRNTTSVGGTRLSDGTWAIYSPRNPDPDPTRPQRPGVVMVPATHAASDENEALVGVGGAGTRSGSRVRLVGTSSAAPQVTRKQFNAM